MKLLLLRHVKTNNNVLGITQPVDGIDCLESELMQFIQTDDDLVAEITDLTLILCGQSIRARRTLSPLLADSDAEPCIRYMQDLNEVDFGEFTNQPEDTVIRGLTMQDFRDKTIQYYLCQPDGIAYPGGESLNNIALRCKHVIQEIQNYKRSKLFDKIIIVGHNRIFRHLCVQLGLLKPSKMFDEKFPHGKYVEFDI